MTNYDSEIGVSTEDFERDVDDVLMGPNSQWNERIVARDRILAAFRNLQADVERWQQCTDLEHDRYVQEYGKRKVYVIAYKALLEENERLRDAGAPDVGGNWIAVTQEEYAEYEKLQTEVERLKNTYHYRCDDSGYDEQLDDLVQENERLRVDLRDATLEKPLFSRRMLEADRDHQKAMVLALALACAALAPHPPVKADMSPSSTNTDYWIQWADEEADEAVK